MVGHRTFALRTLLLTALLPVGEPVRALAAAPPSGIRLEQVLSGRGLGRVVGLEFPKDGDGRMFLVEQTGKIRLVENGELAPQPFLDVSDKITCCGEEDGLIGLEFHPDFEHNGTFYVVYTDPESRTIVSRLFVSSERNLADRSSEREIISWSRPRVFHNGGAIEFGPDGHLYLGVGDGGNPLEAQDLRSLLGKILRLDVDGAFPYSLPDDNPFIGDPFALAEIWAWGLRNPWRFSIDRKTGNLYVGDVGSSFFEEIDFQPGGGGGGENFGWPLKEATTCIDEVEDCENEDLVDPIIAYAHKEGTCNAVTGGYRYRGRSAPTLRGSYIFGDFCRGEIWAARNNDAGNWAVNRLLDSELLISTFAEDPEGNLYLADYRGAIYRIAGQSLFASDFERGGTSTWSKRRGDSKVVRKGLRGSKRALAIELGGRRGFVRSEHPSAETTFRAGFDLKVDQARLRGDAVEVFRLSGSARRGHLRLTLQRIEGKYFLNLLVRGEAGGLRHVGRVRVPGRRSARIEIDWLASTSAAADDGQVALRRDGELKLFVTGLDTHGKKVRSVTLGVPARTRGVGTLLFDNFRSTP